MTGTEVKECLQTFGELRCWKVGLAYGSTLYFEFGERLQENREDPDSAIGSLSLWLYANDWCIEQAGFPVTDAASVNRQTAEGEIAAAFAGTRLESLKGDGDSVELLFSRGLRITLWRPAESNLEPEDDLVHLFFPDGEVVCFNTKVGFYKSKDVDRFRKSTWTSTHP